jgi:excisionase family DNA binding protein
VSSTLTLPEVAERYGVTVRTTLSWIAQGELKAINVARSRNAMKPRWRITKEALEAFELARTNSPTQPRKRRKRQPGHVIEFY